MYLCKIEEVPFLLELMLLQEPLIYYLHNKIHLKWFLIISCLIIKVCKHFSSDTELLLCIFFLTVLLARKWQSQQMSLFWWPLDFHCCTLCAWSSWQLKAAKVWSCCFSPRHFALCLSWGLCAFCPCRVPFIISLQWSVGLVGWLVGR